jgi:hypothetical protein
MEVEAGRSISIAETSAGHFPGSSRSTAIDLTGDDDNDERPLPPSPPAPPPPPHPLPRTLRPTVPTIDRRQSDIRLPPWQPDADVTQCPVCHSQFSFWHRKHHCRKCGRVVCANCSPHRITIPRQFIVRQPEPSGGIIDLSRDGSSSPTSPETPRQLWGGEEVRVCNPCVPDPNLSPPPAYTSQQQRSPDPIPPENWRFPAEVAPPSLRHPPRRVRNSTGPLPPIPGHGHVPQHMGHRSTISDASAVSQAYNRMIAAQHPYHTPRGPLPSHSGTWRDLYAQPTPQANPFYPPRVSSAAGAFGTSAPSHLPAPSRPYHNRPMIDVEDPPAPTPARRQIAEEDECPICSEELPPKGPNGETTDRERHVEECIASHLYTSTPPSRTTSAPPDTGEGSSASAAFPAPIPAPTAATASMTPLGSVPSSSAPLRQRRMTGGRMLVYRATEKDCVAEDGTEAECVICFEEFEPGDEMGRLECLCRFHRVSPIRSVLAQLKHTITDYVRQTCIRQWWDTKGMGSCPTHQLHD